MAFDQFKEQLLSSGLINQKSFEELLKSIPQDQCLTEEELARELHQAKLFTKYQLQLISQGMGQLLAFGDYVLQERIGSGGMGTVYRAIHTKMNRAVAIKILNPRVSSIPSLLERFDREVRATAKLQHLNIVHAYDAGEHNRAHFLVMELVEGVDLNRVIAERGPLSVPHALECVTQVAEGLKYAHAQGMVHRDVKPSNILLSRSGVVKLSDMGLVRVSSDWDQSDIEKFTEDLSRTGVLMGSVNFMSPEQAMDSRDVDERSDIYSLGATLYFLLTGKTMFSAATATKTILAMQTDSPPSIQAVRDDLNSNLEAVYLKMVARDPEDRYLTMGHVLDALKECAETKSPEAQRPQSNAARSRISDPDIFNTDLSLDYWTEREKKLAGKQQSVNVLDEESIHEETDDPTLMQMLPEKSDKATFESSILERVTRSNQRAMRTIIVLLSLVTVYFFARSLVQDAASVISANNNSSSSPPRVELPPTLWELLPDVEEELWTALHPEPVDLDTDVTFDVQSNGFVFVKGEQSKTNRYSFTAHLDTTQITGVRLEVLPNSDDPDETLAPHEEGFRLTGIEMQTSSSNAGVQNEAMFHGAYTDYCPSLTREHESLSVSHVIDGNPETAWGVGTRFLLPHWAVFVTDPKTVSTNTNQVTISLEFGEDSHPFKKFRRFRILVTDKPQPMLQEMIREGNLSDAEKRAAAYLIHESPREASDLLQAEGEIEKFVSGTRLLLLTIAFQDQLLMGPARKTSEELAQWMKTDRTGHPLFLSLAENVLLETAAWDPNEIDQILEVSKLEYKIAAWTDKIRQNPMSPNTYYLRRRASAHARLGHWNRAASDFLKASKTSRVGGKCYREALVALVLCNDIEHFRELGKSLSEEETAPEQGVTCTQLLCRAILTHPDGGQYVENMVHVLDRELPQLSHGASKLPATLATRGLSHYRMSEYEKALLSVNQCLKLLDNMDERSRQKLDSTRALALAIRSLVLLELVNSSEAAISLQEASQLIPSDWKKIIDPDEVDAVIHESEEFDLDWVIAAILLREATAKVEGTRLHFENDDSLAL